jgi:hypothetical protein
MRLPNCVGSSAWSNKRWCVKTYLGKAKGVEVIDIPQQIAIDYEWREVPTVIATVDQGETR